MIHLFLVVFFGFKQDAVSAEDLGTVFTCLPTHMRMVVDLAKNPDLEPEEMHLNDPSCNATEFKDNFVLFEIPLDGCGTTQDGSNPDYIHFSNTAHWEPPVQPITRTKGFKAQITCRYSRDGTVSAWFVPETEEPPTVPKEKQFIKKPFHSIGQLFKDGILHLRCALSDTSESSSLSSFA